MKRGLIDVAIFLTLLVIVTWYGVAVALSFGGVILSAVALFAGYWRYWQLPVAAVVGISMWLFGNGVMRDFNPFKWRETDIRHDF